MTNTLEPGVKESTTQKGGDGCTGVVPAGKLTRVGRLTVSVYLDTSPACKAIQALFDALAELPNDFDYGPVHLLLSEIRKSENFFSYFFEVKNEHLPAIRAGELRLILDMTNSFRELLAAVRAGDLDKVVFIKGQLDRHCESSGC